MCNSHFCCAHSGRNDCKRHIESKQHKDFIKLKQSSRSIKTKTKTNLDMQIVKAEAITCEIITDNNLSLSSLSDKTLEALLVMKSRPGEAGTRHYSEKKNT